MKQATRAARNEAQKEFIKLFDRNCGRHSRYEVWQDFVTMAAIEISNAVDRAHRERRAETYQSIAKKHTSDEKDRFGEMMVHIVCGMDENPDQDFLGELYMALDLGNDHAGQFFTPYDICKMMSKITAGNVKEQVEKQRWISVNDPACGAGATLIAFANHCREEGVNFQRSCLFIAQDIDHTVACMCYLQLSLLGRPGYVVVGNTITNPTTAYDSRGLLPRDDGNVWYTPMFFSDVWHWRRVYAQMDLLRKSAEAKTPEPEEKSRTAPAITPIELNTTKTGQLSLF